jgi:hypothetical protein
MGLLQVSTFHQPDEDLSLEIPHKAK